MPSILAHLERRVCMNLGFEVIYEFEQYGTRAVNLEIKHGRPDREDAKILQVPYGRLNAVRLQFDPRVSGYGVPHGRAVFHAEGIDPIIIDRGKDFLVQRITRVQFGTTKPIMLDPLVFDPGVITKPSHTFSWSRMGEEPPHRSMVLENSTEQYVNSVNTTHTNPMTGWTASSSRLLLVGLTLDQNETPTLDTSGFTDIMRTGYHGAISTAWKVGVSETQIDWSWVTSNDSQSWVGEFSGYDTADGIDQSATNSAGGNVSSLSCGPTGTTSDALMLLWGFDAHSSHDAMGAGHTWANSTPAMTKIATLDGSSGGEASGGVATANLTSTQACTGQVDNDVADQTAICIGTFKEDTGGGGGGTVTMLPGMMQTEPFAAQGGFV